MADSNKEAETLNAKLDSLLEMFNQLEAKLKETKDESRKQYNELAVKIKDRNNKLEISNRNLRNQSQTVLNEMENFKSEHLNKYNELNDRVNGIREDINAKLSELDDKLTSQNTKLESLQNKTELEQKSNEEDSPRLEAPKVAMVITESDTTTTAKSKRISDEEHTNKLNELDSKWNELRDETLNKSQQIEQILQQKIDNRLNELQSNLKETNDKLESLYLNQSSHENQFNQLEYKVHDQTLKIETVNELAKNQSLQLETLNENLNQLRNENEEKHAQLASKLKVQFDEFNDKINENNKSLIFAPIKMESESATDSKEANDLLNELREETQNKYTELAGLLSQHTQLIQSHDFKFIEIESLIANQSELFLDKILSLKLENKQFDYRLTEMKDENKKENGFLQNRIDSVANSVTLISLEEKTTNAVNNRVLSPAIIYSLSLDIAIRNMKTQGYRIVYDQPYAHSSSFNELSLIRSECDSDSVLCVGGAAKDSDTLLLVSCGNCRIVLTETQINEPVLHNGAYWYLTKEFSFGFSPIYEIRQENSDHYDSDMGYNDVKRLSWYLGGSWGGWRLGQLHNLGTSADYRKIVLLNK